MIIDLLKNKNEQLLNTQGFELIKNRNSQG